MIDKYYTAETFARYRKCPSPERINKFFAPVGKKFVLNQSHKKAMSSDFDLMTWLFGFLAVNSLDLPSWVPLSFHPVVAAAHPL
jgi:hypothetical protein